MKKILFIYDHKYPELWRDGLWRALKELANEFEITKRNLQTAEGCDNFDDYDVVLGWGGFGSGVDNIIMSVNTKAKKGLCIGGNVFPFHPGYDILFYETEAVKNILHIKGNCVHAFGVNTDIYNPFRCGKLFDYLGVGSFSSWKRWEKMKDKTGVRLVIGEYQNDNETESLSIIKDLVKNGVGAMSMVDPENLAKLYNASQKVYIPADMNGGGERAVLEARACGIPVEVDDNNEKLKELLNSPVWDYYYYAGQLKKGIETIL